MPERRPNGSAKLPGHSFKVADEIWLPAAQRATQEGRTMSSVLCELVDLYGRGSLIGRSARSDVKA